MKVSPRYLRAGLIVLISMTMILLVAPQAFAQWGPSLGSKLPHTLNATDQNGSAQQFNSLIGDKGLAVVFIRSLDWCPFCKRQIIEINERRAEFEELGVKLVTVSYDSPDKLKSFGEQFDIDLTMLSDPNSEIIDAFGIRNDQHAEGTPGYGIPHPGIAIFDTNQTIRAKFNEESYRDRPQIDDVLASIKALNLK